MKQSDGRDRIEDAIRRAGTGYFLIVLVIGLGVFLYTSERLQRIETRISQADRQVCETINQAHEARGVGRPLDCSKPAFFQMEIEP
jgi:hypothetical protein